MPLVTTLRRHLIGGRAAGLLVAGVAAGLLGTVPASAQETLTVFGEECPPGVNEIVCENARPGTPSSTWDITGEGDDSIQGFATEMSVDQGETVSFKVDTDAADYVLEIYRLGWYQGNGARLIETLTPSATLPQIQPACLTEPSTNLVDCGNWGVSASWAVPADAASGVYVARLVRADTGGDSHVPFIVRDDDGASDLLFQTSDTTWHAYNRYGGANFYNGPEGRAYKLSYNRPITTRGDNEGRDYLFSAEYPMLRFYERNGYDISYISGLDAHRDGSLLLDHQVYLSVGHDEYWSGQQRANVETARDAGVNLAFFSGNEVYWRTRMEPSIDGSATPDRTLVCYKETWDNARIDPSGEWTGTWRDPRFADYPQAGNPENALTGTAYVANHILETIEVPAADGQLRMWRDTSVAALGDGEVAVLAPNTLGYESNEDLDNGFRPEGLIHLSTTTKPTPEYLQDFGNTVAPGTTTHTMTLYRAGSGALVFSAGTIQWGWGLDPEHDGASSPEDPRMQQATVNLMADMGAQPSTLMPGLVAATASTDTVGPTVTVTEPTPQTVANGTRVTVSGTAADTGGVVAAVEVSLDGGQTWRPAVGRESWTFEGVVHGVGPVEVQARAVDDSANIGSPATVGLTVTCPCSIFGQDGPSGDPESDTTAVELGISFTPETDGVVQGIRFYKGEANTGTHTGTLWSSDGEILARGTFANETPSGWQELVFPPVAVSAGTEYVASYHAPQGGYHAEVDALYEDVDAFPLTVTGDSPGDPASVFAVGNRFPDSTFRATNYFVDVLFYDQASVPPSVVTRTPTPDTSSVPVDAPVTAGFSELVDHATVTATLTRDPDGAAEDVAVDVTVVDADGLSTATVTPVDPLAPGTPYTVAVSAADLGDPPQTATAEWSFTTSRGELTGTCPCALFPDVVPGDFTPQDEGRALELGVRLTPDVDGTVAGVRFLRTEGNAGPHVGSLWSADGQLLAQADAGAEPSYGWQEILFDTPVAVTAGEEYVVSYRSPTGRYVATADGFGSGGIDRAPLSTGSQAGAFTYAVGSFPDSASTANYWVDTLFEAAPDTAAPTVTSRSPEAGATSVPLDTVVSGTFSEVIDVTAPVTAELSADGQPVAATLDVVEQGEGGVSTFTLTPDAALAPGTTYTVSVSAQDLLGNVPGAPSTWTFTTASTVVPGECPCGLYDDTAPAGAVEEGDGAPITLGTRFSASEDGTVTGVRFFKGLYDTGTHVGTLWSTGGELLAEATFTGESSTGWQTVTFDEPVQVSAGTEYVVAYRSPTGQYTAAPGGFDTPLTVGSLTAPAGAGSFTYTAGAYPASGSTTTYWVDVAFVPEPPDLDPPVVAATSPDADAVDVGSAASVRATFAARIEAGTAELAVVDTATGEAVAGTVVEDAAARAVRFLPDAPLDLGREYTATVSGARSTGGTAMAEPYAWGFTTASAELCPCSLFGDDAEPQTASAADTARVELGTRFTPSTDGQVTAVRFFKGSGNTGTHIGRLWSTDGEILGQVTFSGETESGWQTAQLAAPVDVTAGTTYVVSYVAPNGGYAISTDAFAEPWVRGPLTAPGPSNGVFVYGGGFPEGVFRSSNYFVDVLFSPSDTTPPSIVGTSPPADSTEVGVGTAVTATFDEPVTSPTVTVTVGGADVAGATEYDAESRTVVFRPDAPLPEDSLVSVAVSAVDYAGQSLAGTTTWTFTTGAATVQPGECPCGVLDAGATPDVEASGDTAAVELGLRFTPQVDGAVTGVRFYKGEGNGGTHVGTLWSASGDVLAQVTFTGESATGWQTAYFDTPVAVSAGTEYVVSYYAPRGRYSATADAFTTQVVNGPLAAPGGANGVYRYGGGFPQESFRSTNYFVDVVFGADGTS